MGGTDAEKRKKNFTTPDFGLGLIYAAKRGEPRMDQKRRETAGCELDALHSRPPRRTVASDKTNPPPSGKTLNGR